MAPLQRNRLIYITLGIFLTVSTYIFMRYTYRLSDGLPFSQEIIAALMGAIITILITAALLNKQTEVELMKEENLKFLELKSAIYTQLLDYIEEIILAESVTYRDINRLRIINQKISFVASSEVLSAFGKFIDLFADIARDEQLLGAEVDKLLRLLGDLSIQIRYDLLTNRLPEREGQKLQDEKQIRRNTRRLEFKFIKRRK